MTDFEFHDPVENRPSERSKLERYRSALADVRYYLAELGYDPDADPENTSPKDMMHHVNGLCVQIIDKALNAEQENET
jgi:hypothetical protein